MPAQSFPAVASALARVGRRFYARGWALGTSGNFSVVVARDPLRLAITPSAASKGTLVPRDILLCDKHGTVIGRRAGTPSAETLLHIEIAKARGAGAVLHTHSVWSTLLSDHHSAEGGLSIEGYEMLKGLAGVMSHEHCEWMPILDNDQDMRRLAAAVGRTLARYKDAHGLLLRRHGLYTWGGSLEEAERHVEIFEFLLEATARGHALGDDRISELQRGTPWHS